MLSSTQGRVWSVMVPTYRPTETYLRQTLESVLAQAPPASEMQIEVVDDASPDVRVPELVRSIAGDRVTTFVNPKNLGLAGCWNDCIARADGRYVHILHQDDIVSPGFYRALENGFKSEPSVGAAFCRHFYFDQDNHWTYVSELERRSPGVLQGFLSQISQLNTIQCPAIAVRRSVYAELGGFSKTLPHTLDWEMWVRISKKYSVYYEPQILAGFRVHSGSTTARQARTGEQLTDIFAALELFSINTTSREASRARLHYAIQGMQTVRQLINNREIKPALRNIRIILSNCQHPAVLLQATRMAAKLLVGGQSSVTGAPSRFRAQATR